MKLWERIPGKRRNMEKRSKQAFQSVLETAEMLLLGAKTFVEKVTVYDYLIWVLGQQIAADGHGAFAAGEMPTDNYSYDVRKVMPLPESARLGEMEMDLSRIPTYTGPWDPGRFPSAIPSVLLRGYRHQEAHNSGIYYPELNFAVMLEGRHHSSLAIYAGECIQPLDVISLEPCFSALRTDGACFEYTGADSQTACSKCADYRFAAMFRLAQMKWEAGMPVGLTAELQEKRQALRSEAEKRMSSLDEAVFLKVARFYEDRFQELRLKLDCAEKENECLKKRLEQNDKTSFPPQNTP